MREILFRGKREDNGEWIEGYLVRRPSAIQVGEHYSPWAIDRPPKDPDDSGEVRFVDGETVGQFTGLTDKNGKRIFEGDIVKHYHDKKFPESYRKGVILWDYEYLRWKRTSENVTCCISNDCIYEVIGNIYDNPELLGVTP